MNRRDLFRKLPAVIALAILPARFTRRAEAAGVSVANKWTLYIDGDYFHDLEIANLLSPKARRIISNTHTTIYAPSFERDDLRTFTPERVRFYIDQSDGQTIELKSIQSASVTLSNSNRKRSFHHFDKGTI